MSRPFSGEPAVEDPFPVLVPVDRAQVETATQRYRENLDAIVATAQAAGVPLLLCTAPSNLSEWPPAEHHLAWPEDRADPAAEVARVRELLDAGRHVEAGELAARALASYPDDALLL